MKKLLLLLLSLGCLAPVLALAASPSLSLNSSAGAYINNKDLVVKLLLNSGGEPGINAAESVLKFNPKELTIKKIDPAGSIFDLWTVKPKIDNKKGTLAFSGGTTKPYKGATGLVFKLYLTPKKIGNAVLQIPKAQSQILAADGWATNVLEKTANGSYFFVNKATLAKHDLMRSQSRGKVLIYAKQKNRFAYINPDDRLRYDFSTSSELELIAKKFNKKIDQNFAAKYAQASLPASYAGRFLYLPASKAYYYVGPVSKKLYPLKDFDAAITLFRTIGADTPVDTLNKIPNGSI